jgi:hypothetical protein
MNKNSKTLEVGARFLKGDSILTLVEIKHEQAVLHRSYRGSRRLFEMAPVQHILRCPNTYKRMEGLNVKV